MRRVWDRDDDATFIVHQIPGLPQRRPGVVEMLQDVGYDHGVKLCARQPFRPAWIVQIGLDDMLEEFLENRYASRINLQCGYSATAQLDQRPGDRAGTGANLEHVLAFADQTQYLGAGMVRIRVKGESIDISGGRALKVHGVLVH